MPADPPAAPYVQLVSLMCRDHVALAEFYAAAFGFEPVPDASVERFTALGATVVKGPFTTYYDARQVVYLDPEGNVFRVSDTQAALTFWLEATTGR
jgi:uncharacterized glyoxalase superfamily protein PhnB